jgi:hypothetical protein
VPLASVVRRALIPAHSGRMRQWAIEPQQTSNVNSPCSSTYADAGVARVARNGLRKGIDVLRSRNAELERGVARLRLLTGDGQSC